jgi:hypothetical protein
VGPAAIYALDGIWVLKYGLYRFACGLGDFGEVARSATLVCVWTACTCCSLYYTVSSCCQRDNQLHVSQTLMQVFMAAVQQAMHVQLSCSEAATALTAAVPAHFDKAPRLVPASHAP